MSSTGNGQAAREVYRIGISMSGAISAGAYTAGVFDFLMQALAELDAARANPAHPDHAKVPQTYEPRVVVMTGASAGGITAALGAVSLGYGLHFQPDPTISTGRRPVEMAPRLGPDPIEGVMPSLYNAWVIKPRMVDETGGAALLSNSDVVGDKASALKSLLNTEVLDQIRDESMRRPPESPLMQSAPYPFLFETLHVYLTITNIGGVQYDIKGDNDSALYHMVNHADRVHFKIAGLSERAVDVQGWADMDNGDKLTVEELTQSNGQTDGWKKVGQSALATAAFPAGLSARELSDTPDGFKDRWFPAPAFAGATINPVFPASYHALQPAFFSWGNMDGGVINNDPFDYARYALINDWRTHASNPRAPADADRAVIMISPFPEGKTVGEYEPPNLALTKVLSKLLPALLSQVRFKVDELAAAADPTIASRWLIAPRRSNDPAENPSSVNIACGALGGFGGFLDQKFREHDYILGRRNCQRFLQTWTASKFTVATGTPVIPLVGSAAIEVPQPQWPKMSGYDFERLMVHIRARGQAVIPAMLRQLLPGWVAMLATPFVRLWWRLTGVPAVRATMEGALEARGQL